MRLDEISENYKNLKAKVVSYTTNESEQARGGQKEMLVPIEVDCVSGSEPEEEGWRDVDEVRRRSTCYNCRKRYENKGDVDGEVGGSKR